MDIGMLLSRVLQEMFWAMAATLGFAILFNVPRRALLTCLLVAAAGRGTRALLMDSGTMTIIPATLVAATVIGFLSRSSALRLEMPSTIFGITAAIPMVPGRFAFETMVGLLQVVVLPADAVSSILITAAVNGVKTGLILGALAVGIVAPSLLIHRERPVV
jgi:uncharacterized membrane protein YjjB (DUF3815 family)